MKRRTIVLAVFAPLLAWSSLSCRTPGSGGREGEDAPLPLALHRVGWEVVDHAYEAAGTLRARETATLTSKVPAYVREVLVAPGDHVVRGQTLALLDDGELRSRLEAAEAARDEAVRARAEAEAGLAAAEAELALAAATRERFALLREKRAATEQELDEVEARYRGAVAGKEMAEARIARAQAGLARAEAEHRVAEVVLAETRVRAPFDGRVLERRLDVGNLASSGTPIFVLAQEGLLRAEVSVPESKLGALHVGEPARIRIEGRVQAIPGRVAEIVPSVEVGSRAFLVKVDPIEAAGVDGLVPGAFVRVELSIGETERLLVPSSAVVERGQLRLVYVVEEGEARLRLVTLGRRRGDRWEVLSGLSEGEPVVAAPPEGLREGTPVAVGS